MIEFLRSNVRSVRRAPGFTLAVVIIVALGVALMTATFAVVRGVLLRPLPFTSSERLVALANTIPGAGVGGFPFSSLEYAEHRDLNRAFTGLAAYAAANVTITGGDTPERLAAARVSANYFDVLGVGAV